ncbi:hypothetical protein M885DRAFT_515504 [Pelagophyceae sp. CCMP2097]|nr:hypothetical protein M885DRAFT_515504 [Pelagophyceae sp. CCMP2097]
MASFRAASLVSVADVEALLGQLGDTLITCESQRARLHMQLHSNTKSEATSALLAQVERSIRDVKLTLKDLEAEKVKLGAARKAAQDAKDADTKRRAPAAATPPGTKLGKYVVPSWIGGRSKALLVARKDGKVVQTLDLAKKDCFVFGRQPELCHIVLEHASVSRQHVVLIHGKPGQESCWHIIDLGSAHGSGLAAPAAAGEKAVMRRLKPDEAMPLVVGSSFRIGKSSRIYTFEADARAAQRSARTRAAAAPAGAPPTAAAAAAALEGDDASDDDEDDEDDGEAKAGTLGA